MGAFLSPAGAETTTHTWTGGGSSDNWSDAGNWSGGVPSNGVNLVFSGTARQQNNNDLLTSVGNVTISQTGFSIAGNALTISGMLSSTGDNSWSIPLTLAAGVTFESLTGLLVLNGDIATGGKTVTFYANYGIGIDGPITVNGAISGTGGLTKTGPGTVTLISDNTYSGVTTLTKGYLAVSSDSKLGAVPGKNTVNVKLNGGYLEATSSFTLNSKRWVRISMTGADTGFWADYGVTLTYGGVISAENESEAYGLRLDGEGSIALSGVNSYGGDTVIYALNVLISNEQSLGVPALALVQVSVNNLSTLQLAGGITLSTPVRLDRANLVNLSGNNTCAGGVRIFRNSAGKSVISAAAGTQLTLSGSVSISTDTTERDPVNPLENLYLGGAGDIVISGKISGNGTDGDGGYLLGHADVVMEGSGTVKLSGANTYSGRTIVKSGTVFVSADSNLGAVPEAAADGRLVLEGGKLVCTSGFTLDANRGVALGTLLGASTGTLEVAASCVVDYAGSITDVSSGSGALAKTGAGELSLTGASSYSLGTTVDAGILRVNNTTGSATGTGAVTVASGATLAGNGFISGQTTLATGATLSPGNSPGTLTIYTNLVLDSSSTFMVEIAADLSDRAAVTGTCTISAGAVLNVSGTNPTAAIYTIISTTEGVTGTFDGLPEGASVWIDGKLYFIRYGAKDVKLILAAVITGYVFLDKGTLDGIMNTGDAYLSGADVRLYVNGAESPFATCTTGKYGLYSFQGVPPGDVQLKVALDGGVLTTVPAGTDPMRNRAVSVTTDAVVSYTAAAGEGVLEAVPGTTLNIGFTSSPLSTALDLNVYATAGGVRIELTTVNESGCDDIVVYAWIGGAWVEVGRVPSAEVKGEGSNRYVLSANGLSVGESYTFKVVDESGHAHVTAQPVAVQGVRVSAVSLALQELSLTFNTEYGKRYVVEVSADLVNWSVEYAKWQTDTGWSDYTKEPFMAGPGTQTQVRVPVAARRQGFFRIVLSY